METEREARENRINIRDNIDLQKRGVALVPKKEKKKKKKRKKESGGIPSTGYHHATPSPAPFINITIKRMRVTERGGRGRERERHDTLERSTREYIYIYIFYGTSNRRERWAKFGTGKKRNCSKRKQFQSVYNSKKNLSTKFFIFS